MLRISRHGTNGNEKMKDQVMFGSMLILVVVLMGLPSLGFAQEQAGEGGEMGSTRDRRDDGVVAGGACDGADDSRNRTGNSDLYRGGL